MRGRGGCCDIEDDCVMDREEDEVKAAVGDDSYDPNSPRFDSSIPS